MTAATSAWRFGEVLAGRVPDRVPFFLPMTIQGAKPLGLSIRAYLSRPEHLVRGQLAWLERLGHDFVTAFHSAAAEVEPFGGEVIYYDDGPPNAGEPPLRAADVAGLVPPRVEDGPALRLVLEATRGLALALKGEVPVLGVAIGPFSLPAMQLGLPAWLDLLHDRPDLAAHLLAVNTAFCIAWCNAQLAAGASAVALAEPLASPALIERSRWRALGEPAARALLGGVKGGVAFGFGSAPAGGAADDVLALRPACFVGGFGEDLAHLKGLCRGRSTLLGGLDAVPLALGGPDHAEFEVRRALRVAGEGGGFILAEHHGEIPWATPVDTLLAVADAALRHGEYRPDGSLRA